jgi:hypothetical protein
MDRVDKYLAVCGKSLEMGSDERQSPLKFKRRLVFRALFRGLFGVYNHFLLMIGILAATQVLFSTTWDGAHAQTAETLAQAKKVYVASLGDKQGATGLRDKLILRLRKCRGIEVAGSPSEADAIITGTGEIWVKGYINSNPKPSPYNRQPVYDGYLTVELRGKDSAILWSDHVTPGKFQWDDIPQDLVNRAAKKLLAALHPNSGSRL